MAAQSRATGGRKKEKKVVYKGNVYIQATFNNTIVTVTDRKGDVLSWSSSGSLGFKGAKKSTPFASQIVSETAVKKAMEFGLNEVAVFVKGSGMGRDAAIRALSGLDMTVKFIRDLTPIPHNGCRPRKSRRI